MTHLRGRAVRTFFGLADHTYVHCPANGQFFDCWGGHAGNNDRLICQGNGIYDVADCYRRPRWGFPDTAGIGVYAVHGVCHQSANCFLYSAGTTLTTAVRGYWFTRVVYGAYGMSFHYWLNNIYNPCLNAHQHAPHGRAATPPPRDEGNELFEKLQAAYKNMKIDNDTDPNEIIVVDAAVLFEHAVPGFRAQIYEDMHRELLKKKDRIVETSKRTNELVDGINKLSKEFQKSFADLFRKEARDEGLYKKLTGLEIDETIDIIDKKIAESASEEIEKYLRGKK